MKHLIFFFLCCFSFGQTKFDGIELLSGSDLLVSATGSIYFGVGSDTYIEESSDNTIKVGYNGKVIFTPNNVQFVSGTGGAPQIAHLLAGNVSYTWNGDTNTGLMYNSADNFSLTTGGIAAITLESDRDAVFAANVILSATGQFQSTGTTALPGYAGQVTGAGDTGLTITDDLITFSMAATSSWQMGQYYFKATAADGPRLLAEVPSATNPTFTPYGLDLTTGYSGGGDNLWLVVNGATALTADASLNLTLGNKLIGSPSLVSATGNEYAININYTTNKATSGDDYGIRLNQTDTASPGTSYLIWAGVSSATRFEVTNTGYMTVGNGTLTPSATRHTLQGDVQFTRTDGTLVGFWNSSGAIFDWNPNNLSLGDFRIRGDVEVNLFFADVSADNIGFGTVSPSARIDIDGVADKLQLRVQGHSTQTNNIFEIENSGGTDLFVVSPTGIVGYSLTDTITASTTQTQGQGPLTTGYNFVTVCANANDTVTFPSAFKGARVYLSNEGANTLQVFPASGDDLGAGVDTSITVAATTIAGWYVARDATTWVAE